ncbi:MAG: hypothetical protein HYY25_02740, partial [Candidatus Wallbacteria bacterium]|nr:hypothetical protein [Candidatus Wallbacteria bacterium]
PPPPASPVKAQVEAPARAPKQSPDEGTLLAYWRDAGRTVDYEVRLQATPVGFSELDAFARISEKAGPTVGTAPAAFHAEASLAVGEVGWAPDHVSATYGVRRTGSLENLASSGLGHPVLGAYVQNVRLLYPALPDDRVRNGISWGGSAILHLPMAGLPFPLPPIRARTRMTLLGVSGPVEQRIANIAVKADSEQGQVVGARLEGMYYVDVTNGRSLGAEVTGTVDARALMLPEPFPVTLTVRTESSPPRSPAK